MDFSPPPLAAEMDEVRTIASAYDDEYWRDVRQRRRAPTALLDDLADADWLGVCFPEEYGGRGGGLLDLLVLMETLVEEGAWIGANTLVSSAVFGGIPILAHGTPEQRAEYVPPIVEGDTRWSISITEKEAGSNTANIATVAERDGDEFVVDGEKLWTSGIDTSDRVLLLARTTPKSECDSPLDGLTTFIVDPDWPGVDYEPREIETYFPRGTFGVTYDGVRVPEENVLGNVDDGLYQLFETLNAERLVTAMGAWGAGRHALDRAVEYARERTVWSEPIGTHQGVQHPLADAHAELETSLLALKYGAWLYDGGGDTGEASNVAKLRACTAAWNACEAALTTFGGIGTTRRLGIAAAWEFVRTNRLVPVSEQMLRNRIGHAVLGLPRSYDV